MKHNTGIRILAAVLVLIGISTAVFGITVYADTENDSNAENTVDWLYNVLAQTAGGSPNEFCADTLADGAGGLNDWYVLSLAKYQKLGKAAYYAGALEAFLEQDSAPAATRQRAALCLLATGSVHAASIGTQVLANTYAQEGIMSRIWGILLALAMQRLNIDAESVLPQKDGALSDLVALQHTDGGFSLSSDPVSAGDVDVTAMALLALADGIEDAEIQEAVARAVQFLAQAQKENGAFSSYGMENCESCTQVILALTAHGIPLTDERFVKQGKTLADVLKTFQTADGYAHVAGGETDRMATAQAFCAWVSLQASEAGEDVCLWHLQTTEPLEPIAPHTPSSDPERTLPSYFGWRAALTALLAAVLAILTVVLWKQEKKKGRSLLGLRLVLLGLLVLLPLTWMAEIPSNTQPVCIGTVHVCVRASEDVTAQDLVTLGFSANGVLLEGDVPLYEGDTAYHALETLCREHQMVLTASGIVLGNAESVYVTGIGEAKERRAGEQSGWQYTVNQTSFGTSAGKVRLQDGDCVEWVYVTKLTFSDEN